MITKKTPLDPAYLQQMCDISPGSSKMLDKTLKKFKDIQGSALFWYIECIHG